MIKYKGNVSFYLYCQNGSRLFVLHLLYNTVGAAAEDADGLEVVGLNVKRLVFDRDGRAGVQVVRDGRLGGPEEKKQCKNLVLSKFLKNRIFEDRF
jgi:hypothetical protein